MDNLADQSKAYPEFNFYDPTVPDIPPAVAEILETYSSVPPSAQKDHISRIRDLAYNKHHYPCLGRWRFLELDLSTHPLYTNSILPTLKAPADSFSPPHDPIFLDIGTCLGQDLRKLVYDGVDSSRVYGSDIHWDFADAGYELFKDEARFGRDRFIVPGDVLDGSEGNALSVLDGRCDVVSANAVFHLFDLPKQTKMAERVVRLLRRDGPGQGKLVVGVQVGNKEAVAQEREGRSRFRHDLDSWRKMWDGVLGGEEWKGKVGKWVVDGKLGRRSLFERYAETRVVEDSLTKSNEQKLEDHGFRWHVWWVWIEFL